MLHFHSRTSKDRRRKAISRRGELFLRAAALIMKQASFNLAGPTLSQRNGLVTQQLLIKQEEQKTHLIRGTGEIKTGDRLFCSFDE